MKIHKMSALLFVLASGCTPEVAEWTPAQSPKENKVDRAIYTYTIHYPSHASGMEKREKQNLFKFLKTHAGSPLAVSVILEEYGGHSESRVRDIERELLRFGIPYDLITVDFEQDESPHKSHKPHKPHKHSKSHSGSGVKLTLERYLVIPPSCGDFSQPIGDARQAYSHSNHGCAVTANLGMMIANPRDLMKGRTLGDSDGTVMAAGVKRYRDDKVKDLLESSTNVAPGQAGSSSNQSSGTSGAPASGGTGGSS